MRKIALITLAVLLPFLTGIIGWWIGQKADVREIKSSISLVKSKPLEKYTIENLAEAQVQEGKIVKKEVTEEKASFTSYLFSFEFNPSLEGKEIKKTTGQVNIPAENGIFPIVVMLRGYVDQEIYKTGDGTKRSAEFFAKNGFITIAPDFLGYAGSNKEAENIFEARFQTYVAVLSLLKSLDQLDTWDSKNIFIWGHSNGGQIALIILEITGKNYPTTLWAPVSKPFPYSILYYTDESKDRGKLIRRELAKFEEAYDVELYSLDNFLDKIAAPLQIHQGTADDAVPIEWSNELKEKLEDKELDVIYYTYPGAGHDLRPSWNTVVSRDVSFFNKNSK